MLNYAMIFLVIAIVAGLLGFGAIAAGTVAIAKVLFFVFLLMFIATVVIGMRKRR